MKKTKLSAGDKVRIGIGLLLLVVAFFMLVVNVLGSVQNLILN